MNGRVFGIKKSTLLNLSAIFIFVAFVIYLFLSIFLWKNAELWFFGFCLFVGSYEIVKSMLFKFDSCVYIGSLLLFIGIFGFIFSHNVAYAPYFISLAFILASLVTCLLCGHRFHLIVAFSIFFVGFYCLLYTINLITLTILLAFVLPFLLLFILEIIWICFHKK